MENGNFIYILAAFTLLAFMVGGLITYFRTKRAIKKD